MPAPHEKVKQTAFVSKEEKNRAISHLTDSINYNKQHAREHTAYIPVVQKKLAHVRSMPISKEVKKAK